MHLLIVIAALALSCSSVLAAGPEWSVLVYAGIDEEEIAHYTDPVLEKMAAMPLKAGVELLIEQDSFARTGTRRVIRRPGEKLERQLLPEHDSASPEAFRDFLAWAARNARGTHRLLIVMTHSWGWKGIVQDYTVPGRPGADTMMPLREFAAELEASELRPDVLFLDSCVLGNVEPIDELRAVARYIVASQRETPYSGFPYSSLLSRLDRGGLEPRELARQLPRQYVQAYSRAGRGPKLVESEGEYDVVTAVALDMRNWGAFTEEFRRFVAGFSRTLEPDFPEPYWDQDSNVDLVTILGRLGLGAERVLEQLGYPEQASRESAEELTLDPKEVRSFSLAIQADEHLLAGQAEHKLKKKWLEANRDLVPPASLDFAVREFANGHRALLVRGELDPAAGALRLRPWLPGALRARIRVVDSAGKARFRTLTRAVDFTAVERFPETSPLLAEAHTAGAPLIHGLGIGFKPLMDRSEERARDPRNGLAGPDLYRSLAWNRRTGWGDLILLNK